MDIKLLIGGKEIDAQISEEDAHKIQPSESRFVRKTRGEMYFHISGNGLDFHIESCDDVDDFLFSTGNYFAFKEQAQDHIRALELWQAIKIFRQEREGDAWKNGTWYVTFAKEAGKLICGQVLYSIDQTTRFGSKETAQAVIDEFYGELMWYFTEFEDD